MGDRSGHVSGVSESQGGRGGPGKGSSSAGRSDRPTLTVEQFARRLDETKGALWCIASSIVRDRAEAEDIVQEAALIGLGKIDQFDASTNFTAWMGSIVRFVALNESRRRQRRGEVSVDGGTLDHANEQVPGGAGAVISSDGRLLVEQSQFDDEVVAALDRLDETARACLLLRTVEGMAYKEIALALVIPEGTAMSHVHRARRVMRAHLSSGGS